MRQTVAYRTPHVDDGAVSEAPDVFSFRDYRLYLKAVYDHGKAQQYGFSLRAFSKRVGLRSSNYLKLVFDGDRNLSPELASRFATASGLKGQAGDYFCELVAFNQAQSTDERERAHDRLQRFSRHRQVHQLDRAQSAYHSQWYIPVIRELCAREDFREDPKWIAGLLMPRVAPADVSRAIVVLVELGLLQRDEDGALRQSEPLVETADGPLPHHVAGFHRVMMQQAALALDEVPRDQREIASLTLCVSQPQLQQLKVRLAQLRKQLLQEFQSDDEARRVVQINFQMFPVSRDED